jgi:hypothetical protein
MDEPTNVSLAKASTIVFKPIGQDDYKLVLDWQPVSTSLRHTTVSLLDETPQRVKKGCLSIRPIVAPTQDRYLGYWSHGEHGLHLPQPIEQRKSYETFARLGLEVRNETVKPVNYVSSDFVH